MIRVLHIIETIGYGGVERRRLSLAKFLDKSQFELKIVCTNAVGSLPDEFKNYNVEVIEIGTLKSFLDFKQHKKVLKIIAQFKPHIIHGAVFEGVTMASINGYYARVPLIILEETSDPANRRWKGNLLLKFLCSTADKVVGVSPAVVNYLENKLKLSKEKVVLITNGVSISAPISEEERSQLKSDYGILNDEIVIGSVGRMSSDSHKRFSDLIKAFALLTAKKYKVKLMLVGDGSERVAYEKLVKELDIENNVLFAGFQKNVNDYYSLFDVFCLVSAYEAFGLVLAEAMLQKLPVVATKVGGMQYIVDDYVTGFLVEKFDVVALSEKLELLIKDSTLRVSLGNNGYTKAIENYTEQQYVEKVANLYLELARAKKII